MFEASGRSHVHVWSSQAVVCEPRRPGLVGPPGFHTTAQEPKRANFRVPAFKNTTKIQREDPQRGKKNEFSGGRGKKKSEILGGPGGGLSWERAILGGRAAQGRPWGRAALGKGGPGCFLGVSGGLRWVSGGSLEPPPPPPFPPLPLLTPPPFNPPPSPFIFSEKRQKQKRTLGFKKGVLRGVYRGV